MTRIDIRPLHAAVHAAGCATLLAACTTAPKHAAAPHAASHAPVATSGGLTFSEGPPRALGATVQALGVDADGDARSLVRVAFRNARGAPTRLLSGGDVRFAAPGARIAWQPRSRFGGPAAILRTTRAAPTTVEIVPSAAFGLAPLHVRLAPGVPGGSHVVGRAVGPHLVQIGWFPAEPGFARILRTEPRTRTATSAEAPYRDATVGPGRTYRYEIALPSGARATLRLRTPPEPSPRTTAVLRGKKMWLTFSPDRTDADAYDRLDPQRIATRAQAAGLRAILLRVSYGEDDLLTPAVRPWLDALLDACAARGVALVAWTVPRGASVEEIAAAVDVARYRDARGVGFGALAADLERGEAFMGSGSAARAALIAYAASLRAALGPRYPLMATVEDPFVEHLTNATFPYAEIARSVDVVQPMTYWRARPQSRGAQAVAQTVAASLAALRRETGPGVALDLGAQSAAIEHGGAPSGAEIVAATRAAGNGGALGVTYFAWRGTAPGAWAALGATAWRDDAAGAR